MCFFPVPYSSSIFKSSLSISISSHPCLKHNFLIVLVASQPVSLLDFLERFKFLPSPPSSYRHVTDISHRDGTSNILIALPSLFASIRLAMDFLRNFRLGDWEESRTQSLPSIREKEKPRSIKKEIKDPNRPQKRLQLHQKCLYERMLPGRAFISAHITRLQHGFYETEAGVLHEGPMDNVSFVSVHFVFHPYDPRAHRFKSAEIRVSIHGDVNPATDYQGARYRPPQSSPRILKHAPELIYGAVSVHHVNWK
jgi:hypothetical protein